MKTSAWFRWLAVCWSMRACEHALSHASCTFGFHLFVSRGFDLGKFKRLQQSPNFATFGMITSNAFVNHPFPVTTDTYFTMARDWNQSISLGGRVATAVASCWVHKCYTLCDLIARMRLHTHFDPF